MNKREIILTVLMASLSMSVLMSGYMSWIMATSTSQWLTMWLSSVPIAWPMALVLNVVWIPQVRRFAGYLASGS